MCASGSGALSGWGFEGCVYQEEPFLDELHRQVPWDYLLSEGTMSKGSSGL